MPSELIEELNEPAYPTVGKAYEFPGMSLRDHFAGQALSSLSSDERDGFSTFGEVAKYCYIIADAMMNERAI